MLRALSLLTNTTFFCGPCAGRLIRGAPDCFGAQVGLEDPGVGRHANFVATGFNASYFRDGGRASNRRFGRISFEPLVNRPLRVEAESEYRHPSHDKAHSLYGDFSLDAFDPGRWRP